MKKTIVFFDTETTGLPMNYGAPVTDVDNWPRLVQLAWLVHDMDGNELKVENRIIKPEGFEIPEEASKIHGITTQEALDGGWDLKTVLHEFASDMNDCTLLIAHNISFDRKIIGCEFYRKEIGTFLEEVQKLCTMHKSTSYCELPNPSGRGGYKWPKLQELHSKLFGSQFEDAHDALADIQATAKCYWKLKELGVINPIIL